MGEIGPVTPQLWPINWNFYTRTLNVDLDIQTHLEIRLCYILSFDL